MHNEGEDHEGVWHDEGRAMILYGIMKGRAIIVYGIMRWRDIKVYGIMRGKVMRVYGTMKEGPLYCIAP